jgi:hypothetical protein
VDEPSLFGLFLTNYKINIIKIMKYTGGKSWFNKSTQEWEYMPRAYTDFYCSIKEWHNLGRGRLNFIAQAIS